MFRYKFCQSSRCQVPRRYPRRIAVVNREPFNLLICATNDRENIIKHQNMHEDTLQILRRPLPTYEFERDEQSLFPKGSQLLLLYCDYSFISIVRLTVSYGLSSAWRKKGSQYAVLSRCHGLLTTFLFASRRLFSRFQFFPDRFVPYQGVNGL